MRFSFCKNNQELGAVSVSHLWSDVYALARHPSDTLLDIEKWLELYNQSVSYARYKGASQLMHRLIEERDYAVISTLLPQLHFVKKSNRIEFRRLLDALPDDIGTPFDWKDAKSLGWSHEQIAALLQQVAQDDPAHDPAEDPIDFIQDWLTDSVLTCGLDLIWVGYMHDKPVALVVAQINPKSGWSRISYMGLVPEYRGQGLGKWIHRKGFASLKQQGGILYHGGTAAENAPMLKLFEQHGCQVYLKMEEWSLDLKNQSILSLIKDDNNLLIETENLVLEPTVEKHAPFLLPLLQDESLYRFIPQNPPSFESLQKLYKAWSARTSPDGKEIWLNWMVRHRATGDYMGHFQAGFDEKNGFVIAYTLGTAYQRKGYATEGLRGVIEFLHTKMKARSIKAWVDTRNEPSIRLVKRLGFEQSQFIKNADEFKGSVSDEFVFELKMNV